MSKAEYPVTQAVRFLRSKKIDFVPYVYAYEEHGGTARFAECTGKPEHQVIKTIVLQDEHKKGLVVLMHGDKHISTRNLARELGLKHIEPATADQAAKWTGYLVGGTSPFGDESCVAGLCGRKHLGFRRDFYQWRQTWVYRGHEA